MAWSFGCKFSLLLDKLYHTAYNSCEGDNIKHNVCCSPHYLNQKLILKLVNQKDRQILLGLNFHIGQGLQNSVRQYLCFSFRGPTLRVRTVMENLESHGI